MAFVQFKNIESDYVGSTERRLKNTLNFENCANQEAYRNPNMGVVDTTSRLLRVHDNVILSRLIPTIKDRSNLRYFDEEEAQKYRFKPKILSINIYGVSDYWWILLAVNGMTSIFEFDNFSTLLIPTANDIQAEVDAELYSHPIKITS